MAGGTQMRIEVLGETILNRRLLRFEGRLLNPTLIWGRIMRLLEASELKQFQSEGAWGGERWAPLADSTLRYKPSGRGILERTSRLLNSLVEGGVAGRGDALRHITPYSLEYGTNVPYAIYHQTGTSRMPQRRVVQLPDAVKVAIVKEMQAGLVASYGGGAIGAAGLRASVVGL